MELCFHSVHKTKKAALERLILLPWEQVLAKIISTHLNSIHIPL